MDKSSKKGAKSKSSEKEKRFRSPVYQYFVLSEDGASGTCKQCKKVITKSSGNTTNMWVHARKCFNFDENLTEVDKLPEVPAVSSSTLLPVIQSQPEMPATQNHEVSLELSPERIDSSPLTQESLNHEPPSTNRIPTTLSSPSPTPNQRNVVFTFKSNKKTVNSSNSKWPADSKRSNEITTAIIKMITVDFQPFSLVENEGFKTLLRVLVPQYEMPSRKLLTKTLLPNIYKKARIFVKSKLSIEMMIGSFTTDLWTSLNGDDFLSLTVHYINSKFERHVFTLAVIPYAEEHTGVAIADALIHAIVMWNIAPERIFSIVTDNAPNICLAADTLNFGSIRCANHTLQLVIKKDSLEKNEEITALITNIKEVVGHFHRSDVSRNLLKSYQTSQGLLTKKLLQDHDVRWNSTYYMLKRFLEQAAVIQIVLPQTKCIVEITNLDWILLERVVEILGMFEQVTKQFEEDDVSLSIVIPLVLMLRNWVTDELQKPNQGDAIVKLLKYLQRGLDNRFLATMIDPALITTHMMATLLDPRFKLEPLRDFTDTAEVRRQIGATMSGERLLIEEEEGEEEKLEEQDGNPHKIVKGIWNTYNQVVRSKGINRQNSSYSLQTELDLYLGEPCLPLNSNPLSFWKAEFKSFPRLAKLAQKYLCIPPGSSISERVFSTAGNVVTKKRGSLNPDNVNMLVFLNRNFKGLQESFCFY